MNELSTSLLQERSKVSHALKSLLDCGFVEVEKKGRERIYSLNKDTIVPLLNIVEKHVKKYCKVCRKIKRGQNERKFRNFRNIKNTVKRT